MADDQAHKAFLKKVDTVIGKDFANFEKDDYEISDRLCQLNRICGGRIDMIEGNVMYHEKQNDKDMEQIKKLGSLKWKAIIFAKIQAFRYVLQELLVEENLDIALQIQEMIPPSILASIQDGRLNFITTDLVWSILSIIGGATVAIVADKKQTERERNIEKRTRIQINPTKSFAKLLRAEQGYTQEENLASF